MTPDEVEAIRERYDDYCERSVNEDEVYDAAMQCADDVPQLLSALAEAQRERDELRKLTATCTCYDGNPQNYEGPHADCAVHGAIRAYNEASADLAAALEQRDDARAQLAAVEAERDRFVRAGQDAIKDLAAAQRREELMRPVVELAVAWAGSPEYAATEALLDAVDTWLTQTGGTE